MFNFGGAANQPQAQPLSFPFTFNQPAAATAQPTTTSLFGQTSAPLPQTQQSSLFGGTGFGNPFGTQPTAPQQTQPQQQSQPSTSFAFGQPTQQQQQSSSSGLFPGITSTFGATPATTYTATNQPVTTSAIIPATSPVKPSTRFADLPDNIKQLFAETEVFIRKQNALRDDITAHIRAKIASGGILAVPQHLDISLLQHRLESLLSTINTHIKQIDALSNDVSVELRYAELAARNLQRVSSTSNPVPIQSPYGGSNIQSLQGGSNIGNISVMQGDDLSSSGLHDSIYLPSPYHWHKLQHFINKFQQLQRIVDQLDEFLQYAQHSHRHDPKLLESVIRNQHLTIITTIGRISQLHEFTEQVKEQARQIYGKPIDDLFIQNATMAAATDMNVLDPTSLSHSALPTSTAQFMKNIAPMGSTVTQTGLQANTANAPISNASSTQAQTQAQAQSSAFNPLSIHQPATSAAVTGCTSTSTQSSTSGSLFNPAATSQQPSSTGIGATQTQATLASNTTSLFNPPDTQKRSIFAPTSSINTRKKR